MKKLLLCFLLSGMAGFTIQAQQPITDANAEKRNISGYHGIEVSTGIELLLTHGNIEEVAVSASRSEFRDKIVTKVEDGILKIKYESKTGSVNKTKENKELKAYVSYKTLDILHVNTGAEMKINNVLTSNSLDIKANTGAIVNGKVDITTLRISQNTGSKMNLSGTAANLSIEGDTGSKFDGDDLTTTNCNVLVSTGAKVTVSAEKELQVKANTGGIVKYKGNPAIREIKTSTGGSVSKI